MNKNSVLFLFLILTNLLGYGQNSGMVNPALPNIISVSPEAASLGQYGGLPVNMATGQLNHTIPLYTIKAGDFEFPLTLTYNYSGLKTDTDPTMVGMGWTANFSGAVIRQLKGLPDEQPNGYFIRGDLFKNINTYSEGVKIDILGKAASGIYDTRPDNYIINTPNLSGSFRCKTDRSAVFSQPRNYNVTMLDTGTGFLTGMNIVDDKGIRHEFNEEEQLSSTDFNTGEELIYNTSWMLKKVISPTSNKQIDFFYDDYLVKHTNGRLIKTVKQYAGYSNEGGGYHGSITDETTTAKIIKRINFPNGYILFDHNIYWLQGTQKVKLQSVSVYNLNDNLIDKFLFDYYDHGYYYFLKSIKKEGSNGQLIDYYSFEYNSLAGMPTTRVANNYQDMWGFYNGTVFNQSNISNSIKSLFAHGSKGALTKIIYPTKGTTQIVYEPNSIPRVGSLYSYETDYPVYNAVDYVILNSTDTEYDCDNRQKLVYIPFSQTVELKLEVNVTAEQSWASAKFGIHGASLSDYDHVTRSEENMGPNEDRLVTYTYTKVVSAGTYRLYADLCEVGLGQGPHYARAQVSYRSIHYGQDPNPSNVNIEIGGIRVKQTIDCDGSGTSNCIKKEYKYVEGSNSVSSSGILTDFHPRFRVHKYYVIGDYTANYPNESEYLKYQESFYTLSPLTILGNHVLYDRVEVSTIGGNDGKVINDYSVLFNDYPIYQRVTPPSLFGQFFVWGNVDFDALILDNHRNMKLLKQTEQRKVNLTYTNTKVSENIYQSKTFDSSQSVFDCLVVRFPVAFLVNGTTNMYNDTASDRFHLEPVHHQTTDYVQASSTTSITESSGTITTQQSDVYDDLTGYLRESRATNSTGQEMVNKYYYPKNKGELTDLDTPTNLALDKLIAQNNISQPIQSEVYNNSMATNSKMIQRTKHKDWGNNIILPEKVQTAKVGNSLENRINFTSYYANGTIRELSKENDVPTVYIWGYNEMYPIAKIENATYSQVAPYVSNLQSLSNGTNESSLITGLNNLRNSLPNSMVTTFTYKPLVGMTSMTDAKGDKITYHYDNFNRLQFVKDSNENILSENNYHYRP